MSDSTPVAPSLWQMGNPEPAAPPEPTISDAWHELTERWTVKELVAYAMREGNYCCQVGCGGGACESCPCCGAGYCVSGLDGVPMPGSTVNPDDDAYGQEVFDAWLAVASQHNPIVRMLAETFEPTTMEEPS